MDIFQSPPAIVQPANERADEVRKALRLIGRNMKGHFFELADYLDEVDMNGYWALWGYDSLKHYINSSELDVKDRQADYLRRINRVSRQLGITRQQLLEVKISKLKVIFTLDPDKFADDIKRLVAAAVNMSLDEVEAEVAKLRGEDTEEGAMTWRNFRVTKKGAEETIDPAIEEIKMLSGSEISNGTALERGLADLRTMIQTEVEAEIAELQERAADEQESE